MSDARDRPNADAGGGKQKRKWVPRSKGKHAGAKRPSVKNQIRSIERLLKRDGVPAKLREEKERELEKLRDQGKENKRVEREKKLSTRYHKVKFFERVKLTRKIERLERERSERGGALSEDAERELASAKEDLEYVMNFPRGEKYVSVLVNDGDTEHSKKERERLRKLVKANLAARASLADENEGGAEMAANADTGVDEDEDDFFLNDSDDEGGSDSESESSSSSSSTSSSSEPSAKKTELKVATDPIFIKNPAQKLSERTERKQKEQRVDKNGNKLPSRTRSEGGRKRRKKGEK